MVKIVAHVADLVDAADSKPACRQAGLLFARV